MTHLEDALSLAASGWPVFPVDEVAFAESGGKKKVPIGDLVEHGFKEATTHARRIGLWWRVRPEALIGVSLPSGTMALDVDVLEEFAAAGLDVPEGPRQQTPRGGYHALLRTDGRPVRQTVKEVPGSDTRVSGLGYIVAWQPEVFPSPSELPMAPEWLYDESGESASQSSQSSGTSGPIPIRRVRRGQTVEAVTFEVGERDNALAREAGAMRKRGYGPDVIYAMFKAMLASGQIESPREDPITDKDLRRIAGSIGSRQSDAVDRAKRLTPDFETADELLAKQLRDLEYPVRDILSEGLGLVAGAPKVGKSWLTLQAAIEIACGGSLLGHQVDKPRPVLYYGLEDGERRFQKRIKAILEHRRAAGHLKTDLSLLALKYEAPAIGEGLEEDICHFIDTFGGDAVVFIDILARVRPAAKGRGSAYDEDYGVVAPLQSIIRDRPGASLVIVTHDRKMGSEDFLTTVTGTRGITGAADWIWVVKRPRLEDVGQVMITGRDIERDAAITAKFEGVWTVVGRLAPPDLTDAAKAVWEAVDANKPCDINAACDEVHGDVSTDPDRANHFNSVMKIMGGLEAKSYVKKVNANKPYLYVTVTTEELVAGHAGGLVPTIVRSTTSSRARGRAPGRAPGRAAVVHDVHVEHVDPSDQHAEHAQHAATSTRAPRRTRTRAAHPAPPTRHRLVEDDDE